LAKKRATMAAMRVTHPPTVRMVRVLKRAFMDDSRVLKRAFMEASRVSTRLLRESKKGVDAAAEGVDALVSVG
jgi:hypothetical protein